MSDTHLYVAHSPTHSTALAEPMYRRLGKRLFDLCLAVLLIPLILPGTAFLALLIARDGGPAFFAHRRVGRGGRSFRCWKLRTMVPDAEAKLQAHLAKCPRAAAEWAETYKLTYDPRVTRLGAFLRKTSLDELPQLWNVLIGEMSFVGPRPVTEPETAFYGEHLLSYLALRPGITGHWQVHGRENGCYRERVSMDAAYARGVSLSGDAALIGLTVLRVFQGTGR